MARMANDMAHAYVSANEDQSSQERRTLFVGKSGGTVEELRFSSLAHQTLWADANESEQTLISYSAESDREESGQTNLIRRESRRLSNEQWKNEPAEIDVLLSDIEKVRFEYYDWRDNDWRDNWDSTQADAQKGRVPYRIRITVEVENKETDETIKYTTQTRVRLQEELRFFTN
jgi:hypothetical protein